VAEEIDLEMCSYGQLSEVQMLLDLGSGQGHISMHNTCSTTSMPNHVTASSHSTKISPFQCREISTFREVSTPMSFPRRKFKNRAPTNYRPGPILSPATISFELHAKVAEETDLEM